MVLGLADVGLCIGLLTSVEILSADDDACPLRHRRFTYGALVDAVRRHVDDRRVLDAIGREVERLVAVEGVVAGSSA
jgi:hypothetical protein